MKISHLLSCWIMIGGLALCNVAKAQNTQNLPGATVGNPQLPLPSASPLQVPSLIQTPPLEIKTDEASRQNSPSSSGDTVPFFIQKIKVEGVQSIDPQFIQKITAPFEGTTNTLQTLDKNMVQELSKLYEKKGYITAVVFIPPQKIEDGVLTIRVEEGIIGEVEFEEGRYFKDLAVEPRLSIKRGEVLNINDLHRSVRRINENPDLRVQAVLKAGNEPGTMRVLVKPAEERFFLHLTPFMDNMGRHTIGNNRLGFTANNNNVLGLGDTAFGNFSWHKKSWGALSGYELPLGKHGTKLGFSHAYNRFDFKHSDLALKGSATLMTPSISQELWRKGNNVLTAELGFGLKKAGLQVEDFTLNEDRIRTLTPALSYLSQDRWGRTMMRHELGIGLNVLNATMGDSPTTSRFGAGSRFCRYTTYMIRAQRLPWNTYGIIKLMGQMTPSRLVSLEQFQIGGASTVRGYQQGLLIGDSGFASSVEWHIPLRFLPEEVTLLKRSFKTSNSIELVAFADNGGVFGNGLYANVNPQSNHSKKNAFLGSVGAGLRLNLSRLVAAKFDLGIPYQRVRGDKTAAWFHFGLESRLF